MFCTAQHYGVEPSKIYLIHDNIDRPVGKFGIKVGGSAGYVVENMTKQLSILWILLCILNLLW